MFLHGILLLLFSSCVHPNNFDGAFDNNAIFVDLSESAGITTLKDYFINSSMKTYINLANNKISNFDDAAFDGVPNLVYLNLSGNSPEFFDFYQDLPNLETLVLDGTSMCPSVNQECSSCNNYQGEEFLMFNDNEISEIFINYIDRLPNLKKLYLRCKNITRMIGFYGDTLPNLTHLYLNQNHLRSWEFLLRLPKSLTHLFLNNNNFEKFGFHEELQRTSWSFDEEGQEIIVKSYKLEYLKNLLYLDVSHNKISEISKEIFGNFTALTTLRLDYNQIYRTPNISSMVNLEHLSLSHNKITWFNLIDLKSSSLKKLNLSCNNIDKIPENMLINIPALEELDLSGNLLDSLPENWISKTNVKYLYLRNNSFKNFANFSLEGAKNIKYLSIGGNPLKMTDMKILKSLSENITIDFS